MRKVNSSLDGLRPSGSALENMFASISESIGAFGREVLNVAEVTLGVILRDAIEFIIGQIRDLIGAIIEAGNEFQMLKIRLTGLNLNDFADGTRSFADAMGMAQEKTREELEWLQTLGAATPFDPAQIANTFTQARAFGFASDEAKRLTADIINYTAGMGLSNETLFLVIQNLGQMVQRGKITGTEIRDLARGSFLPLSDVLERIAKNMGTTVKAVTKQISTAQGIPAQEFVKAFEQMVEEEPRFVGAAGRLSRALVPAAMNVKELFTSIFGLNVTAPVFDVLGSKIASFTDQFVRFDEKSGAFVKTDKWAALTNAAEGFGKRLASIVSDILNFAPDVSTFADALIASVRGVSNWIQDNRGQIIGFFKDMGRVISQEVVPFIRDQLIPAVADFVKWVWDNRTTILGFFQGIGDVIANTLIPFIRDQVIPAFNQISDWVKENKPTIDQFFSTVGQIITNVFASITGGPKPKEGEGVLAGLLNSVKAFMDFVNTHQKEIENFVKVLWTLFVVSQVLIFIFNIVVGVIGFVVGAVITVMGVFSTLAGIILLLTNPITITIASIVALGAIIAWIAGFAILNWGNISKGANALWISLVGIFTRLAADLKRIATDIWNSLKTSFDNMWKSIKNIDWAGLGSSIIMGMVNGVTSSVGHLIDAVTGAVQGSYDAAMDVLHAGSPSKLFMELGRFSMEGFAQGITAYAQIAAGAMSDAMQRVAVPAMILPSLAPALVGSGSSISNNTENNNNYNLTVNSAARTEPIIQDYNMLRSLQG